MEVIDDKFENREEITEDDLRIASYIHLSSLAGFLFPLGNLIGPLIFWHTSSRKSRFLDEHGRSVINFQLSYILIVLGITAISFWKIFKIFSHGHPEHSIPGLILFAMIMVIVVILNVIYTIIGSTKARKGELYDYPFSITFLK